MTTDDYESPYHIDRVNMETRGIFKWLRTNEKSIEKAFNSPIGDLDIDLAWVLFDEIAYAELFRETSGDSDLLYDQMVRTRIMERVMHRWPVAYYLNLLKNAGIMDSIETMGGELFYLKKTYNPSVKTILTESSTRSGV